MSAITQMNVGRFTVLIDEGEVVTIRRNVARKLERIVDDYPTASQIVRFDMAPWDGEGVPPIYEIECSPGGLMFNQPDFPWDKLKTIADSVICLEKEWWEPYQLLVKKTGWKLVKNWNGRLGRVYFSGNKEDVPDGVEIVTDPWVSKAELIAVNGGEIIDARTSLDFGVFNTKYPEGFVLKPVWGWGSRDIYMYPKTWPYSDFGRPPKEIKNVLRKAIAEDNGEWMIQPFFPPQRGELFVKEFTIWRVFAVRVKNSFELLGGMWSMRPTLKVHGASNTISGEIRVEEDGDESLD